MNPEIEHQTVTDLFGNVRYLTPRTKGRPPFEWTEENGRKVSMLLAMGWGNERIAGCILDPRTGLSISLSTLKRHFRTELKLRDKARDHLTAKRLMQANAAAEEGNVGAMRLLDQLIQKNDMALAAAKFADAPGDDTEPKGKKERAQAAAAKVSAGEASPNWGSDLKPGYH